MLSRRFVACVLAVCLVFVAAVPPAHSDTPQGSALSRWWETLSGPQKILLVTSALAVAVPVATIAIAGASVIPVTAGFAAAAGIAFVGGGMAAVEGEQEAHDAYRAAHPATPADPASGLCLLGAKSQ